MSDYGDFCRDMRDHKRKMKDKFRYEGGMAKQIEIATSKCEDFDVKNDGEHYILWFNTKFGIKEVDFWPSTTKWKARRGKANGYGAESMISYFKPVEAR